VTAVLDMRILPIYQAYMSEKNPGRNMGGEARINAPRMPLNFILHSKMLFRAGVTVSAGQGLVTNSLSLPPRPSLLGGLRYIRPARPFTTAQGMRKLSFRRSGLARPAIKRSRRAGICASDGGTMKREAVMLRCLCFSLYSLVVGGAALAVPVPPANCIILPTSGNA